MKISESHVSTSKVSFLNLDSRIRGYMKGTDKEREGISACSPGKMIADSPVDPLIRKFSAGA